MGGFRRAFLGYRREDVDTAIAVRDTRVAEWEKAVSERDGRLREVDAELRCLSGMVLEREREAALLRDQLHEAEERHERRSTEYRMRIRDLEDEIKRLTREITALQGQVTQGRRRDDSQAP